jgi:hypothetical protein
VYCNAIPAHFYKIISNVRIEANSINNTEHLNSRRGNVIEQSLFKLTCIREL